MKSIAHSWFRLVGAAGFTRLSAARLADLVLVPCRPSLLDLKAITTTVDLAALAKTPALAVLNTLPMRGGLKGEAEQVLKSYGVEMAPVTFGHRIAFVHSLTSGQGVLEYEPNINYSGRGADGIFIVVGEALPRYPDS